MLAILGGLALGESLPLAHPAAAAGDIERHDHPVARAELSGRLRPDFLDDPHRLVTEDVTLVDIRTHHVEQVQVGAADGSRGDPDDRVGGLLDLGLRNVIDADIAGAMPGDRLHAPDRAFAFGFALAFVRRPSPFATSPVGSSGRPACFRSFWAISLISSGA